MVIANGFAAGQTGAGGTSLRDNEANGGTTYTYEVWAFIGNIRSDVASVSVSTPPCVTLPGVPNLTSPPDATQFTEGQEIVLQWSAAGSEYYGEITGGPSTLTFGWQSGTSINIGSQWSGYTYTWRVRARNSSSTGSYSSARTFTVKPHAPTGLTATAVSCTRVDLSWNDNSVNESGYTILSNGIVAGTTGASATSYQDTGVSSRASVTYEVRAFRGSIQSDAATASITVPTCNTIDLVPSQWPEWQYPIVPSNVREGGTVTTLYAGAITYIDWGLTNLGSQPTQGQTIGELYLDNVLIHSYDFGVVEGGQSWGFSDIEIIVNTPGVHTLKVVMDPGNLVAETNESNNTWERQFTWEAPAGDSFEPDNTSSQAKVITPSVEQQHSFNPAGDVDHVTFTVAARSGISLVTSGASGDTILDLTTMSGTPVAYNDDYSGSLFAQIVLGCAEGGVAPGQYLAKVSEYHANAMDNYTLRLAVETCPARANRTDFSGDGNSDILWRHAVTGSNSMYMMNGGSVLRSGGINTIRDQNWRVAGVGDFNGDAKADILWRHAGTGSNSMYMMNGNSILSSGAVNTIRDQNWRVAGVGDFNGDGKADILWRHAGTGTNSVYLMNGTSVLRSGVINTVRDQNWRVAGVGDFNGDGKADILWRHAVTGANSVYMMNGNSILSSGAINTIRDQNWRVAGVGDFNGDAKADILWRHAGTGTNLMYLMNGTSVIMSNVVNIVRDQNWRVAGVGDFNGDSKADIVWRHAVTGANSVYIMNGTSIATSRGINTVPDRNWQIVGNGVDYMAWASTAATEGVDESSIQNLDMSGIGPVETIGIDLIPEAEVSGEVPEEFMSVFSESVPEETAITEQGNAILPIGTNEPDPGLITDAAEDSPSEKPLPVILDPANMRPVERQLP